MKNLWLRHKAKLLPSTILIGLNRLKLYILEPGSRLDNIFHNFSVGIKIPSPTINMSRNLKVYLGWLIYDFKIRMFRF